MILLCGIVLTSLLFIIFGQQKPSPLEHLVSTTHQQLRNFQHNLQDAETKKFVTDEKYLSLVGLSEKPRLYPKDVWLNTSLPVFVTYVMEGQESQAIGLINNIGKLLPNNTIIVYNLGLGNHGLRTLLNYCNSSHCQVITFNLNDFPSHVEDDNLHAYRPLIVQDALQRTGAIFFIECYKRFTNFVRPDTIQKLYQKVEKETGILAWPLSKNAVTTLTHKKMFEYFHAEPDNFLFVQMVSAEHLIIINNESIHKEIMLPWVQCALTQDCIIPIGAQSGGCRFDKKPQYRYSGCHSYDASALNIALGSKFSDSTKYTYSGGRMFFKKVSLSSAMEALKGLEQNATTEGRTLLVESITL